jgi:hypothetical protein
VGSGRPSHSNDRNNPPKIGRSAVKKALVIITATVGAILLCVVNDGYSQTGRLVPPADGGFFAESFGCGSPDLTAQLAWERQANSSAFKDDLDNYVRAGSCREFGVGDTFLGGYGSYVLKGYGLVQIRLRRGNTWWVPQKDTRHTQPVMDIITK